MNGLCLSDQLEIRGREIYLRWKIFRIFFEWSLFGRPTLGSWLGNLLVSEKYLVFFMNGICLGNQYVVLDRVTYRVWKISNIFREYSLFEATNPWFMIKQLARVWNISRTVHKWSSFKRLAHNSWSSNLPMCEKYPGFSRNGLYSDE